MLKISVRKGTAKQMIREQSLSAISGAADGIVEFPRGNYRITKTIEIDLSLQGTLGLSGRGASASIIMAGEGPAFRFIGSHDKGSALPASVKQITWDKERMPLIDALEIIGDHVNADGIELRNTLMPTLRALLIRNVRNWDTFDFPESECSD
jgi:hypothetical protein